MAARMRSGSWMESPARLPTNFGPLTSCSRGHCCCSLCGAAAAAEAFRGHVDDSDRLGFDDFVHERFDFLRFKRLDDRADIVAPILDAEIQVITRCNDDGHAGFGTEYAARQLD